MARSRPSGSATATRSSRRRSASSPRPTASSTSGPIPLFVDIEEDSLGIDPDAGRATPPDRPDAGDPAGPRLRPAVPDRATSTASPSDRGWPSIEDACEALGSSVDGRPLGSFGDVAVFAFYPNKQITTGEGGMVVTDDAELADVMRSLRNQGRDARRDVAAPRPARLQLPARRAVGGRRRRPAGAPRRAARRAATAWSAAYDGALGGRDWVRLPAGRRRASRSTGSCT